MSPPISKILTHPCRFVAMIHLAECYSIYTWKGYNITQFVWVSGYELMSITRIIPRMIRGIME